MITLHLKYNDKPMPMLLDGVIAFEPLPDGQEGTVIHFPRVMFHVRESYEEILKIQSDANHQRLMENLSLALGRPRLVESKRQRFLVLDLDGSQTTGLVKPEVSPEEWGQVKRGETIVIDLTDMAFAKCDNERKPIPEVR